MMNFGLSKISSNEMEKKFGDLGNLQDAAERNAAREWEMYEADREKSESVLIDLHGLDFEGSLEFLEASLAGDKDTEVHEVSAKDAEVFNEEEIELRHEERVTVGGGFNAYENMTDEEINEERTKKAAEIMDVSESRAINDPNSPEYKGPQRQDTKTYFGGNNRRNDSRPYSNSPYNNSTRTTNSNQNYKSNRNNNNNNNGNYSAKDAKSNFKKYFSEIVGMSVSLGTQRVSTWREDEELEKRKVEFENRFEKSPIKRQINKMKAFIQTKRFKITAKVACLLSLNIAMGIITKQVEFENFAQMASLVGLSLTTFYLSRELTEDGMDLRGMGF